MADNHTPAAVISQDGKSRLARTAVQLVLGGVFAQFIGQVALDIPLVYQAYLTLGTAFVVTFAQIYAEDSNLPVTYMFGRNPSVSGTVARVEEALEENQDALVNNAVEVEVAKEVEELKLKKDGEA